jgi:hypothetical protein
VVESKEVHVINSEHQDSDTDEEVIKRKPSIIYEEMKAEERERLHIKLMDEQKRDKIKQDLISGKNIIIIMSKQKVTLEEIQDEFGEEFCLFTGEIGKRALELIQSS